MMLITTSHRPTRRTRSFGHDLERVFPGSLYLTRGKKTLHDLLVEAYDRNYERLLIVNVWKGNPLKLTFVRVDPEEWGYLGYLYLHGIKLQRELGFRGIRPLREEMPFVVTAVDPDNVDHIAFARVFAELTGGVFARADVASLSELAERYDTESIAVVGPHPRGVALSFYRMDVDKNDPVGPIISVKQWIMEDGRRWDYKATQKPGQSRE